MKLNKDSLINKLPLFLHFSMHSPWLLSDLTLVQLPRKRRKLARLAFLVNSTLMKEVGAYNSILPGR